MSIISKFNTHSCQDNFHPWNSSCIKTSLGIIRPSISGAFKLYASLFMISAILKKKSPYYIVRYVFPEIAQSTLFLASNAVLLVSLHCLIGFLTRLTIKLLGGFTILSTIFLPVLIASYIAIHFESDKRRSILALYLCNIALDAGFSLAVARKFIRPLPNGEIYLFSALSAIFTFLYNKKDGLDKATQNIVSLITRLPISRIHEREAEGDRTKRVQKITPQCRHKDSCFTNAIKCFTKRLLMGYGLQVFLNILPSIRKIIKNPKILYKILKKRENLYFGLFIGGFTGKLQLLQCYLPKLFPKLPESIISLLTGGIAATSMLWWPSKGVVTYMFTKLIQIIYNKLAVNTRFQNENNKKIFYSLAAAFLVHVIIFEPSIVKPSYIRSLNPITGYKIEVIASSAVNSFKTIRPMKIEPSMI